MSAADVAAVRGVVAEHGTSEQVYAFDRIVARLARYEWVLPIVSGDDDALATRRTMALMGPIVAGVPGDEAIAAAMLRVPS